MNKVIYIAGRIKGNPNFQVEFDAAESYCSWKGWTVLNPTCLPDDMSAEKYMPICLAMLNAADAVVLLNGWEASPGANLEADFARYQNKIVIHGLENVPDVSAYV